jgi:hypothetical protein
MWLEYYRQEDADALFDDLQLNPLFLFGRRITVEYEAHIPESRIRVAESTIQLKHVDDALHEDPWTLWEELSAIAPPVDIRIGKFEFCDWRAELTIASLVTGKNEKLVYVDFKNVEDSARALKAFKSESVKAKFGPEVSAQRSPVTKDPLDENLALPPSDTLRLWNLPARAILDNTLLRGAFKGRGGLLQVRIRTCMICSSPPNNVCNLSNPSLSSSP